ncbi:MAG: hypothetical protein GX217_02935 [Clostridiaceae bacterium]|nr:hypothetical protein [Clostridiaceae bacterium]
MDDSNENFLNEENDEYNISIDDTSENETAIIWLRQIIAEVEKAKKENRLPSFVIPRQGYIEAISVPAHLYNPLLCLSKGNLELGISPVALNEDELKFVKALQNYIINHTDIFADKEIYLIRNRSKKGIGFFDDAGFYPDFIMWMITGEKQYITFIEPHGMARESFTSSKVGLHSRLKTEIEAKLKVPSVTLNSFILSTTKYSDLVDKSVTVEVWNANHVLFMDDSKYIEMIFDKLK